MAKRIRWTDEMVIEEITQIYKRGEALSPRHINREYGGLYRQAYNRYGSWRNAVELVTGLNYGDLLACQRWTSDSIIKEIKERKVRGESLTAGVVVNDNRSLHEAATNRLGSWRNAVTAAGFDYEEVLVEGNENRSKNGMKITKDELLSFIKDRHENGKRISSGYIQKNHASMSKRARYVFGGWKNAVEAAGINYEDIRDEASVNTAGRMFEETLAEILQALSITFSKRNYGEVRPDFILTKNHWVDAKLSEWTSTIPTTISKYEPHVRKLTIVYLRGRNKAYDVSDKTEMVSVHKLLEELPKEKSDYFFTKLKDIENLAEEKPQKDAV
jgi:hypothetical protein